MRPHLRLLLLLALVVALPFVALDGAASETPRATRYYFLSDDSADTYTLFAWHAVDRPSERTQRFALPLGAVPGGVVDQDGGGLQWAQAGDGWIDIALGNDTATFTVTVRDLPGPATGRDVRFPPDHYPDHLVYLGLPAGYHVLDGERIDDTAALRQALAGLPLPAERDYHLVRPDTIGHTLQVEQVSGSTTPYALLAVVLVLLAGTTIWLMRRVHLSTEDPTRPKEMSIMGHLEELRRRIMWVAAVLVGGAIFFFTFGFRFTPVAGLLVPYPFPTLYNNAAAQVFTWLARRVVPPNVEVVVLSPWDAVVTQIGIALALAVIIAFPVLFYHIYAFLAPALYPKERRVVLFTVPIVVLLFLLGATFGIGLMLPLMVKILYGFAGTLQATAFLNVPDLIAIGALMAIVFGIAFELPVVMALLSAIGIVPAATWRRYWRHAAVIIVIVAALVTDPTVITQLLVAGVLFVLYGIGLVLAAMLEKRASETGDARRDARSGTDD